MKIGYVWIRELASINAFEGWDVLQRSRVDDKAQAAMTRTSRLIDAQRLELHAQMAFLDPYVDEVVGSYNSSRELAWDLFIATVPSNRKVLLQSFDEISLFPDKQLANIKAAIDREILVLPFDQKELIDLSIDAAYSLLSKYSLSTLAIKHRPRTEEASYEKMLTLMKQGKSVVEIIEATGWSRSTLFRLRRDNKLKLAKDLPSFKKRYE